MAEGGKILDSMQEIIAELVDAIEKRELVVFCGAGISFDSGLPLAAQFVPYLLLRLHDVTDEKINQINQEVRGKDYAKRQQELVIQVSAATEMPQEAVNKILNTLPFEAFMELLSQVSKRHISAVYNADAPNQDSIKPNTNHRFLAKLMREKKLRAVVTTNFDQLIEKALALEGVDYALWHKEDDFKRIHWDGDGIHVVKIHGSIHDEDNLAITLKQVVSQKLSAERKHIIDYLFSTGSHTTVLILGYSCSDIFDIVPYIGAVGQKTKRVIYIKHIGKEEKPKVRPLSDNTAGDKVCGMLKDYPGVTVSCDTNVFIEWLWKALGLDGYSRDRTDEKELARQEKIWKGKVNEWVPRLWGDVKKNLLGEICGFIAEHQLESRYYEQAVARDYSYDSLGDEGKIIKAYEQGSLSRRRGWVARLWGKIKKHIFGKVSASERINKSLERIWLGKQGYACAAGGDYDKAIECYEQALAIARDIGDKWGEGESLDGLGDVFRRLGDYDKAIKFCEHAIAIGRMINPRAKSKWLGSLGNVYATNDDCDKAIECYEQALVIARNVGDKGFEGEILGNQGAAYTNSGDYNKAGKCYEQALVIVRDIGDKRGEGEILGNQGIIYTNSGDYSKAIKCYEASLSILKSLLGDDHPATKIVKENLKITKDKQ